MKASYRTLDGATAMVAPPFGISDGYPGQKAIANTEPRPKHVKNAILKIPSIGQFFYGVVQFARGSREQIHTVTQALLDDDALKDEPTAGSLEQTIQQMMFNYRIGTDCAGYVQQAFLFSQQVGRSTAKFNPNITNESLRDLESRGFTRTEDPLSALPGDLVVFDPPTPADYGHKAIVYSQGEANEWEKQDLLERPNADPCINDFFAKGSASVLVLDSSWGSGGDPWKGGIQRRKFFFNPAAILKWVRLDPDTDRAMCDNQMYGPDILKGFYRMKTPP